MIREASRIRIGVVLCCLVAICLAGCATTARGVVGQDTQACGRNLANIEK
jgi:predicted small secreted protein